MANLAKYSAFILVLLFGIPILAAQAEIVTVARVIDGDTIFIRDSQGQLVLSYTY